MKSLENFTKVKILIVGDLMLDRYWWGNVTRISPEAPVPVVHLSHSTYSAGGAANVAANVAGLGANPFLIGIVGNDSEAKSFREILTASGVSDEYLIISDNHPTIVKTRVIAHSQQIVRIDQEKVKFADEKVQEEIFARIFQVLDDINLIVLSDYAKGVLNDEILKRIIAAANDKQVKVLIDPKGKNYSKYTGATLITPNKKEAAEACKIDENSFEWLAQAGQKLISEINLDAVLITQGEEGMTLFKRDGTIRHFHALAREIYDVTGAGDTVIASLAVALAAGESYETACEIANIAAGIVVEQVGTTAINYNELNRYIINLNKANDI